MRWRLITIQERLPDLIVSNFSYSIEPTARGNKVSYSYMVQNEGAGSTIGAPWSDQLSISRSSQIDGTGTVLHNELHRTELGPGLQYSSSIVTFIPSSLHGVLYLHLSIDARNQIVEINELRNVLQSPMITVEPLFPDFSVQSLSIVSSGIQGGEYIEFEWFVVNQGEQVVQPLRWYDSILLSPTQNLEGAVKLADILVYNGNVLGLQMTYQRRARVLLPLVLDYSLVYYFILQVNSRGHVNENARFANNIEYVETEIAPPPSPDLQVDSVSYVYFPSSRILTVQWTVRNIGNTMTMVLNWRDQVLLSSSLTFNPSGATILGHMQQALKLQADQAYSLQESFFVPSTQTGDFYIYVMTDISNSVMEIDGEDNNVLRTDDTVAIAQLPTVTLNVSIDTDILPSSYSTGQELTMSYTVTNVAKVSVGASSWVDGIYLSRVANPSRSFLLSDGFLIGQNLNNMQLEEEGMYAVTLNVTLPHEVIGRQFLAVLLDMNNVLNIRSVGNLGIIITIDRGALPDVTVRIISSNLNLTSGQPANIEYLVLNMGEADAVGLWYEALVLSRDSVLDPFDTRLKTVSNPSPRLLRSNESYNHVVEVFIPYDLPTSFYYIIIIVDTRNDLFEQRVDNNNAQFVVSITEAVSTDLALLDVQVSPSSLTYGDMINYNWRIRNNGSIQARGYKCDSIYMSEDNQWDISDYEIGEPVCTSLTINAFNGNLQNDGTYSRTEAAPFLAQRDYYGIVRTRSNIRDPSIQNNIGASSNQIQLNAPTLTLGRLTTIHLVPNSIQVFRIDGVPEEETLVASLTSEQKNVYHDLYVRHRETPTGAEHDAFSQFSLSSFQRAVIRHSRSGTYYLRVESFTNSELRASYDVQVLVKIAQFEIVGISPISSAPLGNVTIRITGTVLSYFSSASLVFMTDNSLYTSDRVYWFSSELVYATFDVSNFDLGEYSIRLVNENDGSIAQLNNSFTISTGIPGQLSINIQRPRALRTGAEGDIIVQIQNVGNTDLLAPHLVLVINAQANIRLVDSFGPIDFSDQIDFLGLSLEGPGGILPPGAITQVNFRVAQRFSGPLNARVQIRVQNNGSAPHAYVNRKSSLKPIGIPSNVWDTIWENFIRSFGTTQRSFQQRLSEIASEFSLIGRKTYSIQEMVNYQLQVAFGLLSGKY